MPYTHCPACRLSTFTASVHSSRDECPRCGTELRPQSRRLFAVPEPGAGARRGPRLASAAEQPPSHAQAEEIARLAARVRELEHLLRLERSRSKGLERGIDALSARLRAVEAEGEPAITAVGGSDATA